MAGSDLLRKQLELVRFEKAIDYVTQNSQGKKHLNSQELTVLNNLLTHTNTDPWRMEAVTIHLPSGRKEDLSVISNPVHQARDIIEESRDRMENDLIDGVTFLYSSLVLHHLFKDANRRTAVAAVYWLLRERDITIPAMGLLELGVGDLRIKSQLDVLKNLIETTIEISRSKG